MGRNYSQTTIKVLFAEAHACAHPNCDEPLTLHERGVSTPVADIAHIRSESPGGPRHEPGFTGDVNGPENLLLLCPKHHRPVDRHEQLYTVEELLEWKRAQQDLGRFDGAGVELSEADIRFYSRLRDEERAALSQIARTTRRLIDRCAQAQREIDAIVRRYDEAREKSYKRMGPVWQTDDDGNQQRIPLSAHSLPPLEVQQWKAQVGLVIESRAVEIREALGLVEEEIAVLRMTAPGLEPWLGGLSTAAESLCASVGGDDFSGAQRKLEAAVSELWKAASGESS